ncbi:8600_t:CDS:1, partial [Ambispora gerdemannii]
TWFLKRGGKRKPCVVACVGAITNTSTDPTLLKSVAYITFVASNNRYSPFLEKPVMVAVEELSSDRSDEEQKDNKEFKYKGKENLSLKGSNVVTRIQRRQALRSLDTNVNL